MIVIMEEQLTSHTGGNASDLAQLCRRNGQGRAVEQDEIGAHTGADTALRVLGVILPGPVNGQSAKCIVNACPLGSAEQDAAR